MQIKYFDVWDRCYEFSECDTCGFSVRPEYLHRINAIVEPATVPSTKVLYELSKTIRYIIIHDRITCGACRDLPGPHQFGGFRSEYPGPGAGKGRVSKAIETGYLE